MTSHDGDGVEWMIMSAMVVDVLGSPTIVVEVFACWSERERKRNDKYLDVEKVEMEINKVKVVNSFLKSVAVE